MKILVFLLILSNLGLRYIAIKNTLYLNELKESTKKKVTKVVPQLSDLKGKVLASYMAELNKDLY